MFSLSHSLYPFPENLLMPPYSRASSSLVLMCVGWLLSAILLPCFKMIQKTCLGHIETQRLYQLSPQKSPGLPHFRPLPKLNHQFSVSREISDRFCLVLEHSFQTYTSFHFLVWSLHSWLVLANHDLGKWKPVRNLSCQASGPGNSCMSSIIVNCCMSF